MVLFVTAIFLFVAGASAFSLQDFSGLKQLFRESDQDNEGENQLSTEGILAHVRHPWYAGAVLLIWSRDQGPYSLVSSTILTLYLLVGAHVEEIRLAKHFGESYEEYRRRVPMFIPRFRKPSS
jgi:protein-S-isoprenylcysteine O-methyltransferase Ste14